MFDDRERRIRGWWKHNRFFYARLNIVDRLTGHKSTQRVRLPQCSPVAEARTAMQDLLKARREQLCSSSSGALVRRIIGTNI